MMNRSGRAPWAGVALAVCACSSVSESDPQYWRSVPDLGGKQYQFGAPSSAGGALSGSTGAVSGQPETGGGGGGTSGSGGTASQPPPSGGSGGAIAQGGSGGVSSSGGAAGDVGTGGGTSPDPTSTSAPPPPPGNSGPCQFTFTVTTVTARGRYAPRNVGAIWISDTTGKFVKALNVWGQQRLSNATAWVTASAGATVDVVTAATRSNHGQMTATWDCADPSRSPVANGTYQVNVTFAESDAFPFFGPAPIQTAVTFAKGTPGQVDGTSTPNFTGMHVAIE